MQSTPSSSSTPQDPHPHYIPTWSKINSKDSCHRYGHASVIINDFMITIGGCSASGFYTNDIIALDLKKSAWLRLRPTGNQLPHCYGHSAVTYKDNQIIVFGGFDGEKVSNKVSIITLDPVNSITKTNCINVSTSGDHPERYFHSAHIYNNSMYVFGGKNGSQENNNQLWCLNLSDFTWTLCQTRNVEEIEARGGHSSVIFGDQMFVFGGYSVKQKIPLADFHALETLTWRKIEFEGLMPTARHGANFVVVDKSFYLFGGSTKEDQYNNEIFVYNPKRNEWKKQETEGNLYSARKYGSVVAWKSHAVIWGGRTPEESLSEIFLLDLDFNKRLLFQKESSDVTFQIGDEEIPAHKEILYEKCAFFKNMFDSGMVESQGGKIQVFETNIEAFKAMLKFIYLNNDEEIELSQPLAVDLLELADKYLLVNLREKCAKYLLKNLEMNKVTAYLEISERLGLNEMEESLLDFTLKNLEKIEGNWEEYKLPEAFLWRIIFKLRKSTGINVGSRQPLTDSA